MISSPININIGDILPRPSNLLDRIKISVIIGYVSIGLDNLRLCTLPPKKKKIPGNVGGWHLSVTIKLIGEYLR